MHDRLFRYITTTALLPADRDVIDHRRFHRETPQLRPVLNRLIRQARHLQHLLLHRPTPTDRVLTRLWDALSDILEDPHADLRPEYRQRALRAVEAAFRLNEALHGRLTTHRNTPR